MTPILQMTRNGLFCETGGFHVDPWRAVDRALVTHAHADHARYGSKNVLCAESGRKLVRQRVGDAATIEAMPFGQVRTIHGVEVSFHPAGHILGSAQIRLAHRGQVCVVSGDYKTEADPTCEPFEPVACHHFITESTFGLPVYHWKPDREVFADINQWWAANRAEGRTSIIGAYALGKAQRLLAGVDATIGPILVHGAVDRFVPLYRGEGIELPPVEKAGIAEAKTYKGEALVIAPPSAFGTSWIRKFQPASLAFASGWMQVRGARRRRAVDRGFVLSDHADWDGLQQAIASTGAERVEVTHGYTEVLVRWLREQGVDASELETRFGGERNEEDETES
ncbi:MAG: ligase-associated DNA damage response exonuclease [Verrucomicrobiota bacterium]